jgi:hypothetical protein
MSNIMKNTFITLLLLVLLSINHLDSQIIKQEYYNGISINPTPLWKNCYIKVAEKGLLLYNGFNNDNIFINSGFVIVDSLGNQLKQKEFIMKHSYSIDNIIFKDNCYHIFSNYCFSISDPYFSSIPHKYVLDTNLNILEEKYDTTSTAFKPNHGNSPLIQYLNDSIYILHDITNSLNDSITILDFNLKSCGNIITENIKPNLSDFNYSQLNNFLITNDKNFLLSLTNSHNIDFIEESQLIKLSYEGEKLWTTKIKFNNKLTGINSVIENNQGDFICSGLTWPNLPFSQLYKADKDSIQRDSLIILKIDKGGVIKWIKEYPLINHTKFLGNNLSQISNGNYYVLWGSYLYKDMPIDTNKRQNFIIRISNDGDLINDYYWREEHGTSSCPMAAIDNVNSLIVYGYEMDSMGVYNKLYLTTLDINITSIVNDRLSNKSTILTYPNPATQVTTIKFDLEQPANVSLKLTDMFGKQMPLIDNQFMDIGSHSYDWDASGYPAGVYYYVLQINGWGITCCARTGKVVVVK